MTITSPVTIGDLPCEEIHAGFDALIKRVAELAAERDVARKMASQATKDLVRARHELILRDAVNAGLTDDNTALSADNRRLTARVHELAIEIEDVRTQLEQERQPRPDRASWWSRRIGNRL